MVLLDLLVQDTYTEKLKVPEGLQVILGTIEFREYIVYTEKLKVPEGLQVTPELYNWGQRIQCVHREALKVPDGLQVTQEYKWEYIMYTENLQVPENL